MIGNEVTLDWLKVAARQYVTDEFLETVTLRTWRDELLSRTIVELRTQVLAENLPPERVVADKSVTWYTPATWWDHLKQTVAATWWARWWVTRRPPRLVQHSKTATLQIDLQRYWAYPEARPLAVADFGRPVRVHTLGQSSWWDLERTSPADEPPSELTEGDHR